MKPRRIWEDDNTRVGEGRGEQKFPEGLPGAGHASVIKGTHPQAGIPPLCTLLQNSGFAPVAPLVDMRQGCDDDADDEMSSDCSGMDQHPCDNESRWSASSPAATVDAADVSQYSVAEDRPGWHRDDGIVFEAQQYERGAFSPVYEDDSPQMIDGPDVTSSPIGPATPFGEFVDRAVATADSYTSLDGSNDLPRSESPYHFADDIRGQYQECEDKVAAPMLGPVVVPSTPINYKKLAEPLADWVASYVWKMCTTGMSLPSEFVLNGYVLHFIYAKVGSLTSHRNRGTRGPYSHAPPSCLAESVHSLFLSTLLQPSAILLALWYIARLPVFFGDVGLRPEHVKELRFRAELLGVTYGGIDMEASETNAPFRLILLGCMLANKWLDDHTFSNKTW